MAGEKKIKVKFVVDYEVKDAERTEYKAGKVYPMSEASALHFVSRGVAEIV